MSDSESKSDSAALVHGFVLRPCPFCGFEEIDPEYWMTTQGCGPGCPKCSATAEDVTKWNTRASDVRRDNAVVIWKEAGKVPNLVRCDSLASDLCQRIREVKRLYPQAEILVAYTMYPGQIEVECAETVLAIDEAERLLSGEME